MSIAILKKKTFKGGNPRVDPISGSSIKSISGDRKLGFNINGVLRLAPTVGDSQLNYFNSYTSKSNSNETGCNQICKEDYENIKVSVKNTKAMLAERKNLSNCRSTSKITCDNQKLWVQSFSSGTNLQNSQGQYISYISSRCFAQNSDSSNVSISAICKSQSQVQPECEKTNKCKFESLHGVYGFRNLPQYSRKHKTTVISKPTNTAISSSEYQKTKYLYNNCIPVERIQKNAKNKKLHFPPVIIGGNCNDKSYTNQVIAANAGIF